MLSWCKCTAKMRHQTTQWLGGTDAFSVVKQDNDEEGSGRSSLCEEPRIARDVEALVLEDRHITVEAIVEKVKISHGSVFNILHNILNMAQVSSHSA